MNEKVIAFIPARCGSKSIPLKNIKNFCGKPLIYWNLKSLQNVESIVEIFVGTDCEKIKKIVSGFGFSKVKVYMRNKKNARDKSPLREVLSEFTSKYDFDDEDILILVQATSPFTQSEDFERGLKLYQDKKADSLLTCVRIKRLFWRDDGNPTNYDYTRRPRRQDFEGTLMENGAFYINKIKNIKKSKHRLIGNIVIYEMPEYTSVELDEEDDWVIAEHLMKKYVLSKHDKKSNN